MQIIIRGNALTPREEQFVKATIRAVERAYLLTATAARGGAKDLTDEDVEAGLMLCRDFARENFPDLTIDLAAV